MRRSHSVAMVALAAIIASPLGAPAQTPAPSAAKGTADSRTSTGVQLPAGYVIGQQDVLDVVVYKEKEMSADGVVVRPDGKISLPLVNDIDAVGLTVEALRLAITKEATKYTKEPTVSVVVKEINSRYVSITGNVAKPAQYPLLKQTTVMELISTAGGLLEYADSKKIRIARTVNGKPVSLEFNFKDFIAGKPKALLQNIELQPKDIVTVP